MGFRTLRDTSTPPTRQPSEAHSRRASPRRHSSLFAAVTLLAVGAALSCSDPVSPPERPPTVEAPSDVVASTTNRCGPATTVDLLADETISVGTVEMSNDDEHLYVTYRTSPDWPIGKTSLFVGDDTGEIPTNRGGNPVIGRFPYVDSHSPETTEVNWEVDLDGLSESTAVVAAFAEVGENKEGAWAAGELMTSGGSWATYATHEIQSCEQGPTAIISAPENGTNVQAGTPLAFDGSSSEDPAGGGLVYAWDFGDDELGGGAQLAHVFASDGTFTVTLTVTDVDERTDQAEVEVMVTSPPAPVSMDGVLRGHVVDETGSPLPGVDVALAGGGNLGSTDDAGEIVIEGFPTGVDRTLRLSLTGFADDIVRVRVPADIGVGYFEGGLRPRNAPLQLGDAAVGGIVSGEDGAEIELPAGALVAGNGDPVSGPVDVAITPVDVSGPELAAFPGSFEGVGPEGTTGMILSLGATEYVLTQGGQELQLAPGATATVRLPIYTTGADMGDPVPLWALDEASGLWIQEGEGIVVTGSEGPVLEAEVGHLSWWNVDIETDVMIVFSHCQVPGEVVTWNECLFGTRTVDDGPAWAGDGVLPTDGDELPLPSGTSMEFGATVFADECVARGSVVVDIPASGEADPIEVEVECIEGGDPAVRIEYGDRVIDEIEVSGEVDRYVWEGVEGEEVRVDFLATSGLDGFYRITDPDGDLVEDGTFGDRNDHRFFTLEKTGDYQLELLGEQADDTGFYRFRVDRFVLEHMQALTLPASVEGTIGFPELEVDIYQFEAAAGDEVSFAIETENRLDDWFFRFEGEIRVLSPTAQVLAEEFFGHTSREIGAGALRLPEEGAYTIEVRSRNGLGQPDDPGAYAFELHENPSTTLEDGVVLAEAISHILDVDAYSFELATAETVRITLASPTGEDIRSKVDILIHDPDGVELVRSALDPESHWFIETPADGGEHRVAAYAGSRSAPGTDYELSMDVFEEEPTQILVEGDAVTGEIGFPQEVDRYQFEGQEGEEMTLAVEAAQTEPFEGTVEITGPSGVSLTTGVFDQDVAFGDVRTLSETGTYTVEVAGTDGIPFAYEITLALAPPPDPNVLTAGDIIESSIDVAGGSEEFTFEGTSGQAVRVHAITATSSTFHGAISLTAPSGTGLLNETLNEDGSVNAVFDLTEDGTYSILIEEVAGTGSYKLGLGTDIGRRDLTFGSFGTGEVRADFGSGTFNHVESLPDGRILAKTSSELFRFEEDGTSDASFGTDGKVRGFDVFGISGMNTIEVLPDASILMATGVRTTEFNGWKVAKIDADGAVDPSFGTGGVVDVPFEEAIGFNELPASILVVPDGADDDILVVGTTRGPDRGPLLLTMVRLDADGSLDGSFGGGTNPLITSLSLSVTGGVQQSDGRIVVGGSSTSTAGEATAYRFDPDGTQDLTFGTVGDGEATIAHGTSGSIIGMEIRSDDRFILHGQGFRNMLALQFTSAGAPDASFGTDGIVLIDYGHSESASGASVDEATGDLYLSGALVIRDSGEPEGMLVRLLPDGSLDGDFGAGGLLFETSPDGLGAPALDGSGRLLVGGGVVSSSTTATLLRLLP